MGNSLVGLIMWKLDGAGPNWSKQKWIVSTWRGAVRISQRKTEGCRRKCKSWEHSSFLHSSICTWILQQPSPCALNVSVWRCLRLLWPRLLRPHAIQQQLVCSAPRWPLTRGQCYQSNVDLFLVFPCGGFWVN